MPFQDRRVWCTYLIIMIFIQQQLFITRFSFRCHSLQYGIQLYIICIRRRRLIEKPPTSHNAWPDHLIVPGWVGTYTLCLPLHNTSPNVYQQTIDEYFPLICATLDQTTWFESIKELPHQQRWWFRRRPTNLWKWCTTRWICRWMERLWVMFSG